jgi:hypothetical protein
MSFTYIRCTKDQKSVIGKVNKRGVDVVPGNTMLRVSD